VSSVFDYFVRREVARKMKEEEQDPDIQVFFVPFKVQEQIPPVVGKAMDEWTKEDVAKMEAEAEQAIETNFPSYFDEVQKTFFASEFDRDGQRMTAKDKQERFGRNDSADKDVTVEEVLKELLEVSDVEDGDLLKDRLELIAQTIDCDEIETIKQKITVCTLTGTIGCQNLTWREDACSYLQHQLDQTAKLKNLMNVADVNLSKTYNFYHSPFPEEVKLVLQPL